MRLDPSWRTLPSHAADAAPLTREDAETTRRCFGFSLDVRRFGYRRRFASFAMLPVEDEVASFVDDRRESRRAREKTQRPANAVPPPLPDTDLTSSAESSHR